MELHDFTQAVNDRSKEVPVLVDFWAPWCGPCQVLGPVIEQMAQEADGRWELLKINVDESREVANTYRIMSIPTVMLFFEGKPLDHFAGALPKYQIQQWLSTHLPDKRKKKLQTIIARLQASDNGEARQELEEFVAQNSDMEEAKLVLAKELVVINPSQARNLLLKIKIGHQLYEEAEDVRNLIDLMEDPTPSDHPAAVLISKAQEALSQKKYDMVLSHLVESMKSDKSYGREVARRACIALFHLLGESHELTRKHRPIFGMALY